MRLTRRHLREMIIEAARLHEQAREAGGVSSAIVAHAREENVRGIMIDITNMTVEGGGRYMIEYEGPVHAYITTNLSADELARVWRGAIQSGAFTESVLRSIADSQHATGPIFKISDDVGDLAYELLDSWTEGAPHPLRGIVWIYHEDQDAEPDPSKKWGAREPNTLTKV